MNMSKSHKTRALAVTGGAVAVALAAGGVALATTPSSNAPAPAATSSAGQTAPLTAATGSATWHRGLRVEFRRLVRHTVHAELIVKTKNGYKTVDIDRGSLTQVSTSSILITRPDGPTVSATITPSTKFVGLPESQLHSGDRVVLVQTSGNAVLVGSRPPASTSSSGTGTSSTS